ncbi:MAG: bifunctional pyr operon transcriptional regulator/uracil phosphoribosyltransferase [Proteobacteria bacterium]|nr:bifunctional pyr operon transcriptional regulator/uracil phosphoribosyltransferase [Pseudomonadota bacterium]
MNPALPDAEALVAELVRQLAPRVTAETGIVGIYTGGVWLAERLHRELGLALPLGSIDISFYRDDYAKSGLHASVKPSQIPFEVAGRHILLVDDVLYTGRTVRGALNEIFDYGRPASVSLVVLVDRDGRELPISAQYVGATLIVPEGAMLVLSRSDGGVLTLQLERNA